MAHDPINHPVHYTSVPSGVECIQITRWRNFNVGNAIKYLWRAGLKENVLDSEIQDLKKARWYIDDEIARLEELNAKELLCPPVTLAHEAPLREVNDLLDPQRSKRIV